MADTLPLDGLAPEARRELVDFYEFLKAKYGNSGSAGKDSGPDPFLYEKVKIDTTKLRFTRDEIHERR
ncbi:MAG: hypothetical protein ACOYM2_17015 [Rectinemataceae bacterium]